MLPWVRLLRWLGRCASPADVAHRPAPPALLPLRPFPAAVLSPPGSSLIAHNITAELLALISSGAEPPSYAPFPPSLVATWRSGHPPASDRAALAAELAACGWQLRSAASRARVAAQACERLSGGGKVGAAEVAAAVDFEARPDEGRDRWSVFFAAGK